MLDFLFNEKQMKWAGEKECENGFDAFCLFFFFHLFILLLMAHVELNKTRTHCALTIGHWTFAIVCACFIVIVIIRFDNSSAFITILLYPIWPLFMVDYSSTLYRFGSHGIGCANMRNHQREQPTMQCQFFFFVFASFNFCCSFSFQSFPSITWSIIKSFICLLLWWWHWFWLFTDSVRKSTRCWVTSREREKVNASANLIDHNSNEINRIR